MTLIMTTQPNPASSKSKVDILILGAGWTSTFLIPLCEKNKVKYAATTTTGRDGTLKFKFSLPGNDEKEPDLTPYSILPLAKTILITFPLRGGAETHFLVDSYIKTHSSSSIDKESAEKKEKFQFIQLGSTGIWSIPDQETWLTRHSPYNTSDARAQAEDALLARGGCVLDLAGLWGGERNPRHWIERVAATKEQLAEKKSLHLIHGLDVARGILGVHGNWKRMAGERFMLTDLMVYDWWELILGFVGELAAENENGNRKRLEKQEKWIGELMQEKGVRALPRDMKTLGRCYDTREFWNLIGIVPTRSRVSSVRIGGQY